MRKQSKSEDFAKQLAKLLGCKVNTICTIEKRKETFAFESNHKIKRTLRVILASAKKQRIIGISDNLTTVIREYKEWYDNYREALGDRWINSNRLFIKENGDGLYPSTVEGWVHKICQAAGLPNRTVHSLRHTNITMQIAAGVPLVTVSGRAGHARTSTTTDIYSHFLKSSDRTAAKTLENVFCKG